MAAEATVFFGLWLQKPLRIAAANPSGPRFADALARCVALDRPGAVLELGAGTGSITRGLDACRLSAGSHHCRRA